MTYGNVKETLEEQEQRAAISKADNLANWYKKNPWSKTRVSNYEWGIANIYDDRGDEQLAAYHFEVPNM